MDRADRLNALTHGAGVVLAVAGSAVLIVLASLAGDPWTLVGVSVYGLTLVAMYTASVLYHSLHGQARKVLRALDHQSIYWLIAGSYTPFCLIALRGPWGWSLLGSVWGLALLGGLQELRRRSGARILSVVVYVAMGWMVVVALVPLIRALGPVGFAWVAAGGVFYTAGIVFYALDERMRYAHAVWHLFVLAGSATHYVAILRLVAPAA